MGSDSASSKKRRCRGPIRCINLGKSNSQLEIKFDEHDHSFNDDSI